MKNFNKYIIIITIFCLLSSLSITLYAQTEAPVAPELPTIEPSTESPTEPIIEPTIKPTKKPEYTELKTSIRPAKSKIKTYTQKSFDENYYTNLVNKYNRLPSNFVPKNTVSLPSYVRCTFSYLRLNKRAAKNLKVMFDDAKKAGITLIVYSALRTKSEQTSAFNRKVNYYRTSYKYDYEKAYDKASSIVAIPNTSEHQTGLAVDIVSTTYRVRDSGFANDKAGKWLQKNSYKYGFNYRYQKAHIKHTYIVDEPWHFRYLGKKIAKKLYKEKICLEEYYDQL